MVLLLGGLAGLVVLGGGGGGWEVGWFWFGFGFGGGGGGVVWGGAVLHTNQPSRAKFFQSQRVSGFL